MRFSLRFNNDLPVRDYVRYAQAAEAAGFHQFWVSNDLFLRSAPVILSAVAIATERIEIGSCILNPFTIHPSEIAMFAATLDELSGGRFNLGISSGAEDFMRWLGLEFRYPRTRVLETVQAINKLTSNQNAASVGVALHWTEEAWLRFRSERRVPIYLGAMSPKMLEAIGEVADGGLPLLFPPEHYANILPQVQRGLARSGRTLKDIDLAACIWCSLSEDQKAAESTLADKIAYYGHAMSPTLLEQLGLAQADFAPIRHAWHIEGDREKARRLVTPQMLRIGIAGTTDNLLQRLDALVALGVRHISFGPPLGPDIAAAIQAIGAAVIPHFARD
ncbi:MAG: LLM class flavin-dependent oxidoreductase [Chloroflexota bacterium]|nr:LLM class flavin-dependent oxidoreductase [Chloroflexota bacterium]MDE2910048.1 LLM class flavin-dependent oxidoreductase [Chloroflexota bacterium]